MFKLIGSILLLLGCGGYGYMEKLKLKIRLEQLEKLRELLVLMKSEITYKCATLGEVCLFLSEQENIALGNFLEEIYHSVEEEGEEFALAWRQALESWGKDNLLSSEDIRPAMEFAGIVKVSDIEMQAGLIDFSLKQLEERILFIKKEYEKKGKAYLYLGVAAGAMGVILLL